MSLFLNYRTKPLNRISYGTKSIDNFISKSNNSNIDWETVESFGAEWGKFSEFSEKEVAPMGAEYFDLLEDEKILNKNTIALDVGCGTGRWTKYIADKVKLVEAIDPSDAVFSAATLLEDKENVRITKAEVSNIPFKEDSFDLVFSLGVLHHIPDTPDALKKAASFVKRGGYFLVYLYYNLEDRGMLFRTLFWLSNLIRRVVNKLPNNIKAFVCDVLAIIIYMPFVLLARIVKAIPLTGNLYTKLPLFWYWNKSFNVIRNDSLDRFGTPLEQRFSKSEIMHMMEQAGLSNIKFSDTPPFWKASGIKE